MTVELARHLVRTGVLAPDQVQQALQEAMSAGHAFVKVLVDRSPATARVLDRELARLGVPVLSSVRLARDLARDLPPGMCARLLAVPVGRDPDTGYVNVAAADPLDTHIGDEFGFHLASPVIVYRAPISEIEAALEAIPFTPSQPPPWRPLDESYDDRTPAYGAEVLRTPLVPRLSLPAESDRPPATQPLPAIGNEEPTRVAIPSAPPIPLVRRTGGQPPAATPPPRPRARFDTNPGLGISPLAASFAELGQDEFGEPILGLVRSKAPPVPESYQSPEPTPSPDPPTLQPPPQPEPSEPPESFEPSIPPDPDADPLEDALEAMPTLDEPDEVLEWLVYGASGLADVVVVFAAHKKSFDGRAGSDNLDPQTIKALHVLRAGATVFDAAVHDGHYVGPVPATDVHVALRAFLGPVAEEVCVVRVAVSDRPALMLLAAGMHNADVVAERLQPLARKAGFAIERILLSRKL